MDSTYIIFGASGDLANRYLLPAIKNVGLEPILISRKDYLNIKNIIPTNKNLIFHLAIPPEGVPDAVKLIHENFAKENIKILLEKPFGKDLKSAQDLVEYVSKYFREEQIYRVDHYLAKQSLQNLVGKKENITRVEIMASEKLGIEGRINFYEQTGALRDFVQSHMLEMAAVTLAGSFDPEKRQDVLKNLSIVCDITKNECVKRGQYEGYRAEVSNPNSMTETFVSLNLMFHHIPVTLTTGKALHEKLTQIKIKFQDGSEQIFDILHEPDAYQRVIKAAIDGKHDLFISKDEVLESWRILEDVQETWKSSASHLSIYPVGSTKEAVLEIE
jgi:glucose-6-phosphate 1-dehydrogenase